MPGSRLRLLRVLTGAAVLTAFLATFIDLRSSLPTSFGFTLASTQFVPALLGFATGAVTATALILIVGVTLLFGRVYCSAICPLGILQDVVARVRSWLSRRRPLLPFRSAHVWVRRGFLWGTLAGMLTGWYGFTLSLLDPYSTFGRIASGIFRPLVGYLNNVLAGGANAAGLTLMNRVEAQWAAAGALALPLMGLTVVTVMAARSGRLYCNTVCPVGTLLGWLSARGAFRLTLDSAACPKCGDCLRVCKAQCLDLRTGTIDASRCVACYNCINACTDHRIGYRFAWQRRARTTQASAPAATARQTASTTTAPDQQRRAFVAELGTAVATAAGVTALLSVARAAESDGEVSGDRSPGRHRERRGGHNESRAIAPPGAGSVNQLLEHCTACHLCISACPTHVLQPAFLEYGIQGLMKPRLDFAIAYCNFDCRRCSEVCPDGALAPLSLEEKHSAKIGVAKLDLERCIVKSQGTDCAACSEHCPTKAVDTKPYGDNLRLPWVHGESCIGCGACEFACPVEPKAIRVTGHQRHGYVRERPMEKAAAPVSTGDFPF